MASLAETARLRVLTITVAIVRNRGLPMSYRHRAVITPIQDAVRTHVHRVLFNGG